MLLRDIVNRNARMYPQRTATVWGSIRHTFAEFRERINRLANALMDLNVVPGDRVAVLLQNCSPYLELHFAIPQAGMIIVTLNYRNRERELVYAINDSGANTLIAGADYIDTVNALRPEIPAVKNFISIGRKVDGYHEYEDLLSRYPAEEPKVQVREEDICALIYTSGTTGRAKGVMITQKNVITQFINSHATIPLFPEDICLNCFPYYHVTFVRSTTFMAMGATNICADFSPRATCELMSRERVTQLAMTPAQVNLLVNYPDVAKYDLSSARKLLLAGGPCPLATLKKFFDVFSKDFEIFRPSFGMTEACGALLGNTIRRDMLGEIERKMGSFKRQKVGGISVGVAYPYCEVRIVNEKDEDLPPGAVGEIIARGDNVMKGYWRQTEATQGILRNGWLHSGDLGFFTNEGEVYVVDRKKDMILSGDENIYPAEVEEVLHSHPSILEAAVIGVPDAKWGETVKAIVVLKEGARATSTEIIEYCKGMLSSYKKPTSVDFVDRLPRNPSGKVLKTELRKPYWGELKK